MSEQKQQAFEKLSNTIEKYVTMTNMKEQS